MIKMSADQPMEVVTEISLGIELKKKKTGEAKKSEFELRKNFEA